VRASDVLRQGLKDAMTARERLLRHIADNREVLMALVDEEQSLGRDITQMDRVLADLEQQEQCQEAPLQLAPQACAPCKWCGDGRVMAFREVCGSCADELRDLLVAEQAGA